MFIRNSISHWVRLFLALLLIGLILPASPAIAQDDEPPTKLQIDPIYENEKGTTMPSLMTSSNLIQDPSFEASLYSMTYWGQFSANHWPVCTINCASNPTTGTVGPRSGSKWVWLGGVNFTQPGAVSPEVGGVYQYVRFPGGRCTATLQFYFWIGGAQPGSDVNDSFRALIDGQVVFSSNATEGFAYPGYTLISLDVSRFASGGLHQLVFDSTISDQIVNFNLDDVSLVATCTRAVTGDYNGDIRKDIGVYRPSNGTWYLSTRGNFHFGETGDQIVPGDYDGDLKQDIAVYRPSNGTWYISTRGIFAYGQSGDLPVPGDYDGNGQDDIAVFRPSNGTWYISSTGIFAYGQSGDIPVPGDYNGDGRDDIAVYRPSNGTWYISTRGNFRFGESGDVLVPADYDGDGKDDFAVYRPSTGMWYISTRGNFHFGETGDIPMPGDYNGDGLADIAVYRPSNGMWYISSTGNFRFGELGDTPL